MNLTKLFETQRKLDERIVKEKGLEGQDLLPMKILALQVELGELANEWRGFKFWSEDREPRTVERIYARGSGKTIPPYIVTNPLLEEYVDCLHFILSIGLELGIDIEINFGTYVSLNVTQQFNFLFTDIAELFRSANEDWGQKLILDSCDEMCCSFIGLGEMLGFTWEQIEEAYYAKNQINHERQSDGY